ncbi:DNA polymerase III alpha subunit [hydrothermal vent metagenome]|uniref:DNA polymerase III subunit alpha n=1 Tax=hydrothermal vent metagenome TaxID=652676 RepID=A0A3B1ACQ4_9ZZZZ
MPKQFVHLNVHSEYSLSCGVVRIKPLAAMAAEQQMPAVAITDQSNLFAMVKFYRAAMAAGVKPIIGVDAWVEETELNIGYSKLILLCRNQEGYKNLTKLISLSYQQGQIRNRPIITREWLQQHADGLIVLSGGKDGDIGQAILANRMDLAEQCISYYQTLFPDNFYLELQRTGRAGEEEYLHAAVELAIKFDLPVVATNSVHFLKRDDFEPHEARVCISDGRVLDDPRRPKIYTEQQYFRTADEMIELFSDLPEAIENTVEIAKRCNVEFIFGKNYLPDYPVPDGMTIDEFLIEESRKGLDKRLEKILPSGGDASIEKEYKERLKIELDVIIKMGFPGYFLIVADFIRWSKEQGIPVGPGRGSGAGSIVAYALTITDLDPIKYELLFERFLNPERVSMPDFDIDFCMEGRDRVIDYVAQHYGRDKVSQIITYGSMAAKAVIRDVGRVMGHPYGFVDRIAKLIPFEIGITLDKAMAQEETLQELYDQDEQVATLIDMAKSLEGISRNAGKHAGGVVIAPTTLTDFTPLYCEQGSDSIVTQFDKDDVEAIGLVKFDFLGLRTLTIINWAVLATNAYNKKHNLAPIEIESIPLDCKKTFELLKAAETTAVFQLESRGMKDLIKRLQPDNFEDIIALVALFRPGPLQSGMVDDFINRKHGRAKVVYPHPDLEPILSPTYGVILYQEQVMQIAQVLAGYSLGGADLLRRAMGKKKSEEMEKQRVTFTEGAVARGVEEKTATYIFDLMEKFAGYGFNKSHSAAYALVSYQTAWLKTHYPAAFMAAVLSADMDNTDKVVTLIDECLTMNLTVNPPNVNECQFPFSASDEKTIIYGLGAIKGVGEAAIDDVIQAKQEDGDYKNLFDFCQRIDGKKVNRRTLDALIMAGAMDVFKQNRATLLASLPKALKIAVQHSSNIAVGQNDMFGVSQAVASEEDTQYEIQKDWSDHQRLACEKQTLGLYLTGHPIEQYLPELAEIVTDKIINLRPAKKTVIAAGLIIGLRVINTRRGKMAILTIDDRSARIEVVMFSEGFEKFNHLLSKDKVVVIEGEVSVDDYSGGIRMSCNNLYSIDQAREHFAKHILIDLEKEQLKNGYINDLKNILQPFQQGGCEIVISYQQPQAIAKLSLGEQWRVHPTDELLNRLIDLNGEDNVKVVYDL